MAMSDISTDTSRLILRDEFAEVAAERLFGYWVTPALLTRWWPQVAEVEPQVGGAYAFSWPGAGWLLRGRYTAFEPGRELGFSWSWEHEPEAPVTEVGVSFEEMEGGGTVLTLTHGPYDGSAGSMEMRAGHLEGWTHFLGRLHGAVEQSEE